MFMSKDELSDDEEMGGGDVVVPLASDDGAALGIREGSLVGVAWSELF